MRKGPIFGTNNLLDGHAAARQLLLVEMGHQRVERWAAALDRVVPDLWAENLACRFQFVDHPRQADGQRVGVVHPVIGDVAGPAEGAIEADRQPGVRLVKFRLQHEGVHDRENPRFLDNSRARLCADRRNSRRTVVPERFGDHHRSERVDLAALQHGLERGLGRHEFDADAFRRLDGADRPADHPGDVLGPDAVFVRQESAHPHRRRHLVVADADALALQVLRLFDLGIGAQIDRRMPKHPRWKHRNGDEPRVTLRAQDRVGRQRHFRAVELSVIEHAPERLARAQRNESQIDAFGLDPAVDQRLGAVVTAAGQCEFQFFHGNVRLERGHRMMLGLRML